MPAGGYPLDPARTQPHFAQRDYSWRHPWGSDSADPGATATGVVAVLTTPGDTREDWLAAGQALQRVLLHASAYGVGAAFHTQALEMRHLREELCSGEYPQMITRLGVTFDDKDAVRRPVEDLLG